MITNITIDFFRQFKNLEIKDLKQVNFIIGENGCGKTSLIEAIFLSLAPNTPELIFNISRFRGIDDMKMAIEGVFHNFDFTHVPIIYTKLNNKTEQKLRIEKQMPNSKNITVQGVSKPVETGIDLNLTTIDKNKSTISYLFSANILREQVGFGINITKDARYINSNTGLFISDNIGDDDFVRSLAQIKLQKKDRELIECLQFFDTRIQNIEIVNNQIYINHTAYLQLMPLNLMGDGLKKFLKIVSPLVLNLHNTIIIDEIENGLHVSTINHLLISIFKIFINQPQIQLFITTHNNDILKSVSDLFLEEQNQKQAKDVNIIKLRATEEGILAFTYSVAGLTELLETNIEIR